MPTLVLTTQKDTFLALAYKLAMLIIYSAKTVTSPYRAVR